MLKLILMFSSLVVISVVSTELRNVNDNMDYFYEFETIRADSTTEDELSRETTLHYDAISTIAPTTEKNYEPCPEQHQSAISKEDLNTMIDSVAFGFLNIYESINNSYYSQAVSIRDKHSDDLKYFIQRLEDRPGHVKHILSELEMTRTQDIEPLAKRVASKLKELPLLEDELNNYLTEKNETLKKLNNYKTLCALLCSNNDVVSRSDNMLMKDEEDSYFCSSIDAAYNVITDKLTNFQTNASKYLLKEIEKYDKVYESEILWLKQKMKESAVSKFSLTMYDVLSLQDDYYHLKESLKDTYITSQLNDARKTLSFIRINLRELQENVDKYKELCYSCSSLSRYRRQNLPLNFMKNNPNLLNQMLNDKINQYNGEVTADSELIFKELLDTIHDKELVHKIIINMEPMQNELETAIKNEEKHFQDIKKLVSFSALTKLSKFKNTSDQVLQDIIEAQTSIRDLLY